jgi:hypothetical protein
MLIVDVIVVIDLKNRRTSSLPSSLSSHLVPPCPSQVLGGWRDLAVSHTTFDQFSALWPRLLRSTTLPVPAPRTANAEDANGEAGDVALARRTFTMSASPGQVGV